MTHSRSQTAFKAILAATILAALVGFYASGLHEKLSWDSIRSNRDALRQWVEANPLPANFAFFAASVAIVAFSIPIVGLICIAGGAMFGFVHGSIIVSFALTTGATLAFLANRTIFRDWARKRFGHWLTVFDRGMERDGALYLMLLRAQPLVPGIVVNAVMGLTNLPVRTFWWATQIGQIPIVLIQAYAGTQLSRIEKPGDLLSAPVLIAFSLLTLLPIGFRLAKSRAIRQLLGRKFLHQQPLPADSLNQP